MRTKMAKEVVNSVLDYFSLYMTFARLRNDLRTVEHFEDCWRLVFIQFFGSYRVPTPSPMVSCQSSADPAPRPRPRWFTEKYSRPVRKVVGRTTERVAGMGHGEYFSVTYDVLECGHKKESSSALTGAPPAKHRRCNECSQSTCHHDEGGGAEPVTASNSVAWYPFQGEKRPRQSVFEHPSAMKGIA